MHELKTEVFNFWSLWVSAAALATSVVGLAAILYSLALTRRQMRDDIEWNKRKAAQETLLTLVTGPMQEWRSVIEVKYGCPVVGGGTTLKQFLEGAATDGRLTPQEVAEYKFAVLKCLNLLEAVCIYIRQGVLSHPIAYDFLGKVVVSFYDFAEGWVQEKRAELKFYRGMGSLEEVARAWKKQLAIEEEWVRDHPGEKLPPTRVEDIPPYIFAAEPRGLVGGVCLALYQRILTPVGRACCDFGRKAWQAGYGPRPPDSAAK